MWLSVAIIGHVLNGLAFLLDKFLITKRIPQPAVYAFFVCLLVIVLKLLNFASKKDDEEQLLKIVAPADMDYEKEFEKIFSTYLTKWNIINVEDIEGMEKNEITYMVRFKKAAGEKKATFIHDLKKLNKENRVSLFGTEHLVY